MEFAPSSYPPILNIGEKLLDVRLAAVVAHPESRWVRKCLFHIHVWIGVTVGAYVLMMSLSGSVMVYRNALSSDFARKAVTVIASGPRLSSSDLEAMLCEFIRAIPWVIFPNRTARIDPLPSCLKTVRKQSRDYSIPTPERTWEARIRRFPSPSIGWLTCTRTYSEAQQVAL